MKRYALGLAAIGLLMAANAPQGGDTQKELQKFQGAWSVVALEINGRKAPAELLKNSRVEFKGDKYTFRSGEQTVEGTVTRADPSKTPKEIDTQHSTGASKGKTVKGIYEVEGDTLKLRLGIPGDSERPKTFVLKAGEPGRLYVLKHNKP
jgi:uncharacterized protein (TIGR03067 family)